MNWSRVKTVLIILFLCTDIFLLGIYFTSKYSSSVISDDVIASTIQVLKNNNITVDPSVIPKKMSDIQYAEAENVIPDYEAFAKNLLGDQMQKIDFGYESNRGKVTFYGDRFNFIKNTDVYLTSDIMTVNDEKTAKDVASMELKNLGFNLDNAKTSVTTSEFGYSILFENSANGLPIFNSQVTAVVSKNGLTSVSGIWFNETLSQDGTSSVKSITSALIDFIPQVSTKTQITGIELGYNIFDRTSYHKSATLIPVWKITTKDGNTYLLDARNY